jgi:spore maturation protein CgeB
VKLVIFGLTLSSSWGNGHATLWRGLVKALARNGHTVVFFERDVPYYAAHRDLTAVAGAQLVLYGDWTAVSAVAARHVGDADAVLITSYCATANSAARLVQDTSRRPLAVFYDLDTPVTLARVRAGEAVEYLPAEGLGMFDLVLSFTGGGALDSLRAMLGAKRVAALYGHVDPEAHRPVPVKGRRPYDLSYLGTYAPDRQRALCDLFIEPARRCPERRFLLGGSGYPQDFPWMPNISFRQHVAPPEHCAFYGCSRLTLNVTRADMANLGFCPSGRLFEAAACGVPLLSDDWEGMERFFARGREILIANTTAEAEAALALSDFELSRIARAARDRVLSSHTSAHRATQLLACLEEADLARGAQASQLDGGSPVPLESGRATALSTREI